MSNSKDDDSGNVQIVKRPLKIIEGIQIQLTTQQAIEIAEFVDSPIFKLLKNVYVAQRKDHIARGCLNGAQTGEQLQYFKGMAAELTLFFKNLEAIKKTLAKDEE